jgi:hypothetical protein
MMTRLGVVQEVEETVELGDLLNDDLPRGYQTVPGWWAVKETGALTLLSSPIETFMQDAETLEELCAQREASYYVVVAPPAMSRAGIKQISAFPVWLLTEFYPANP